MNSNGKSVFGTKKLTLSSSLTTFRSHRHFSAQQQPSAAMRRHVRYPPPLMSSSGRRHRLCSRLRRRQGAPSHFHPRATSFVGIFIILNEIELKYVKLNKLG